jgi:hypothetical protein
VKTVNYKNFWPIILAKEFRVKNSGKVFQYQKNTMEKMGHVLRFGLGSIADLILREIKNPIMIIALTAIGFLIATFLFYPTVTLAIIAKVFPFIYAIKFWMIKLAIYISLQLTVLGVSLRTLGHLQNKFLMDEWSNGNLESVFIGDRRRR